MRPTRRDLVITAGAALSLPRTAFAAPRVLSAARFVTYQPSELHVRGGVLGRVDETSIRRDLAALRPWFDGLITYGANGGADRIIDVAATLGFRAVILGVWDFRDAPELDRALAAAARHPGLAAGLSLGNEIVVGKRGTWRDIADGLQRVRRRAPHLALGAAEPFAEYLDHPDAALALRRMDFLMAHVHPIFEPWFASADAAHWADFVVKVTARLAALYPGPVLVRETGVPSAPAPAFTPAMQAGFWRALRAQFKPDDRRAFAYFSAFDAPWRPADIQIAPGAHPEEAHWGLFDANRKPKPAMAQLPRLG